MCPSCGKELCKNCQGCHNEECELYIEPSNTCEVPKEVQQFQARRTRSGNARLPC